MVDPLSLALRGLSTGFVLALLVGSAGLSRRARLALWPLLICLAAYLVRSDPFAARWPAALLLPLSAAALLFPASFWWLVHNAFDDRADVPWPVWPAAALLLVAGLTPPPLAANSSVLDYLQHVSQKVLGGAFVIAALWQLWRGRAEDLVPRRRLWRSILLAYIGAHGLTVLVVEWWLLGRPPVAWLDMVNIAVIALALAATMTLLLGIRSAAAQALFGAGRVELPGASTPATKEQAPPADEPPGAPAVERDAREPARQSAHDDNASVERLQQLMAVDCVYRDPELDIGTLAKHCRLAEYRLRELINQQLGFRNFSAFVNEYRLRDVEQRLADTACARLPILTLALDAGFGSVGPFNRAFRERHGMTPPNTAVGRPPRNRNWGCLMASSFPLVRCSNARRSGASSTVPSRSCGS